MNQNKDEKYSVSKAIKYGIGQFSDTIAVQMFNMYVFTFYFTLIIPYIDLITIVFIIWAIWNAVNDPMLGALSDKTKTKMGRRKPYIIAAFIPLCFIVVFLFTPPTSSIPISFVYFLFMVILFDITYTAFDLNYASLFPEMFQNLTDRAKANSVKQVFTIIGLIFGSVLPPIFIPKLDDPIYLPNYSIAAIFMALIIAVGIIILILFGIRERREFAKDYETAPPLFQSLKFSIKNKSFRTFIIANLAYWYVIGLLPMIVPLYGIYVLNIPEGESTLLGLLLATTFISAAIFMIMWRYVALKLGMRRGYMLSFGILIVTLIPFMLISTVEIAFIGFFITGIGLSGALLFGDIVLSAIIDQDELSTGIRREGGYYGINALITKLSTILVILSINLVFRTTGWEIFSAVGTVETEFGLRCLMFIFPAIALAIGIIAIYKFPINRDKYDQIKKEVEELHSKKKDTTRSS